MRKVIVSLLSLIVLGIGQIARADLTPVATYFFNNTLAAQQGGVPSLTAVDPLATSGFVTDTVFGNSRTVYNFSGSASPPANQAGLSFDNSGGLIANSNYSAEMVFQFVQNPNGWRRILDVQNRQSDNGFYVDPSSKLAIFPVTSNATFTNNAYHHVVLTVSSAGQATAYLDGVQAFSTATTVMNINNPQNLVNFFLDNTVGGGQGEYSSGDIALIRLYNGVLAADQVATLAANPFGPQAPSTPEPSSILLVGCGVAGVAGLVRRKRVAG